MKEFIAFLLLFFTVQVAFAQQTAKEAFSYLTWIDAEAESSESIGSLFGYDATVFTPVRKRIDKLPKSDVCYLTNNDMDYSLIGRYKNSGMTDFVNILYSPGPSADPTFRFTDKNNRLIWEFTADELCINANGVIYTAGITDKMFDERCKFELKNNAVTEVKQPYLYVGIKDKLRKPVKLYSHQTGGTIIATLPAGYEIEVMLSEDYDKTDEMIDLLKFYLARTAFGLVGWLRLSAEDMYHMDPVVVGLGYHGD